MLKISEKELKQYTKDELVSYIMKIKSYVPDYEEPIKRVVMWKRFDEINKRIDEILKDCTQLAQQYNDTKDYKLLIKLQSLSKERDRLWAKEKRLQKELFD